jgi:hypothetical protein
MLIVTPAGRVDTGSEFNYRHWRPAFTTADLTYVEGEDGMHALRHFYASTLLAPGVTIKELADYLGHPDPGFTLRTYTHLLPSSHEQAGEPWTAYSSRVDPRSRSRVLGRPVDGLDGCRILFLHVSEPGTRSRTSPDLVAACLIGLRDTLTSDEGQYGRCTISDQLSSVTPC